MAVIYSSTSAPSNKPQVTLIAYGFEEGFTALIPKIDKITFTYDIPVADREPVLANLFGLADGGPLKDLGSFGGHRYQKRFALTHPGTGEKVIFEAAPKPPKDKSKKLPAFTRFEFNPARLGAAGVEFLRDQLVQVFFEWHPWSAIAVNCKVTRLDIAVDLVGVRTADLIIEQVVQHAKAKPGKKWCYFSPSGVLETANLGFKKGQPVPIIIYDKAQELTDKGGTPIYGGAAHARVERRMQPNRSIASLAKMKNPLMGVVIIDPTKPIIPPETPHAWTFFLDSCRMRGRKAALSLLSAQDIPAAYVEALKTADRHVWRPGKLWTKWPEALKKSGLLP